MTTELERQLTSLKQGDHICPIYEHEEEQLAEALPFITDGLVRGERCLYVADDRSAQKITRALAAVGVDVAHAMERGALRVWTKHGTYLQQGEFHPRAMIDFLRQEQAEALAAGFTGYRQTGEMTWALGREIGCDQLIEFEALLNEFSESSRSIILCQYNRQRFDPAIIHDVMRTHPIVILGDQVCPNPYYEPPELVLCGEPTASAAFKTRRVGWWIRQLKKARAAEQEREHLVERLRTLSRQLLEVQEAERRHLARELHDEVGQMLTGLRFLLKPNGGVPNEAGKTWCEQARGLVDELLDRIRGLSFDLRPAALDQLGLLPALLALFERFTSQTGVLVSFKHLGVERRFTPEVETAAYRIVQEALTNVARHAGVPGVAVRVWATADVLGVQIEDRGRGFDPEAALAMPRSSGLSGMQERALLLGGRLTIESRPGAGAQVTAELPLGGPPSTGSEVSARGAESEG